MHNASNKRMQYTENKHNKKFHGRGARLEVHVRGDNCHKGKCPDARTAVIQGADVQTPNDGGSCPW